MFMIFFFNKKEIEERLEQRKKLNQKVSHANIIFYA